MNTNIVFNLLKNHLNYSPAGVEVEKVEQSLTHFRRIESALFFINLAIFGGVATFILFYFVGTKSWWVFLPLVIPGFLTVFSVLKCIIMSPLFEDEDYGGRMHLLAKEIYSSVVAF